MRPIFAIWLILSVFSIKSVCSATSAERQNILQCHNKERGSVTPTAANMQMLTYSDEMEKLAASWVANCKFDHPDPNVDTQYAGTGQNLALFGTMPADVYSSAASMWNQEKKNYDYATDTCTGSCGHYKQVIWAETTAVGCAYQSCPIGVLVACQYKPPGNMVGMKPYVSGKSCSQCASTDYCVDNQCSKTKDRSSRNQEPSSSLNLRFQWTITLFSILTFAYLPN